MKVMNRSITTSTGARKVTTLKLFNLNLVKIMMTVRVATADEEFIRVPLKY